MNEYIALTRLLLSDISSRFRQQANIRSKRIARLLILIPLLIAVPFIQVISVLHTAFAGIGHPELTVTYVYMVTVFFAFMMAVPVIVSSFFYAKDLSLLASLPIKPGIVALSKLTVTYVSSLTISLLLNGISIYFYAIHDVLRPFSILTGIVAILVGPLIPVTIAVILMVPLMQLVAARKRRGLWMFLGSILLIASILSLQVFLVRLETSNVNPTTLFMDENGLLNYIGQHFPPSIWLTRMVMGSPGYTVLFLAAQAIAAYLAYAAAKSLYRRSLRHFNEAASGQVSASGPLSYQVSSIRWALIKRHIGIILHTPSFLLQIGISMFIPVVWILITTVAGAIDIQMLRDPLLRPYLPYIFSGILTAPAFMTTLSATSLTREGSTFWETRALPIAVYENLASRVLSSDIFCAAGALSMGIPAAFFLKLDLPALLIGILFSAVATHFLSTADLFINIARPRLNWTNPMAAVKNNLNILFAFVLRVLIGGVFYILIKIFGLPDPAVSLGFGAAVLFVLFIVARLVIYKRFVVMFNEIEC